MPLTEREQEFLDYLSKGFTQTEAGERMGISRQRANQLFSQLLSKGCINVVINEEA